jgi:O-methyltransferase
MKQLLKNIITGFGFELRRIPSKVGLYNEDGITTRLNHDFVSEPKFVEAYSAAKASGEMCPGPWRVHVALWAATVGSKLEGDFVECGVNNASLSSAILTYLPWQKLNKQFHLFDTWAGLDPQLVSEREKKLGADKWQGSYRDIFETVKANLSKFERIALYRGSVPGTLSQCDAQKVCYLSLDMNCMQPEIAALEHFWPKMSPGAIAVLDDYGWNDQHIVQKEAFDRFAAAHDRTILSLPTGQGVLIR